MSSLPPRPPRSRGLRIAGRPCLNLLMQEAPDFETAKREALAALPALAGATQGLGVEQVLEAWIRFASTPFFGFFHRFDPRGVLPHLEADDEIGDGGYELDL